MKMFRRNQKGFTLVELAIVLVIIGIILGAVLKGQELIKSSKYKRTYSQAREIIAGVYSYYDRWGRYPGDDPLTNPPVAQRWNPAPVGGVVAGNNNGWIDGTQFCNGGEATESCVAWQEMRVSNILSGATAAATGRASPNHPFGGRIAIGRTDTVIAGWAKPMGICWEWLNNETARWLDTTYDDGTFNGGTIRGNQNYYLGTPDAVSANWVCMEF